MYAVNELIGLAQIGVGIAGFAGVAAAILLGRSAERDDQLRFLALMCCTMSVVIVAFLPILLSRAGLGDRAAWGWSSATGLGLAAVGLPIGLAIRREAHTFRKHPPKWAFLMVWLLFASAPVAHALNLLGLLNGPGPALFLAALLGWLAAGAMLFAIIVLVRPAAPTAAAPTPLAPTAVAPNPAAPTAVALTPAGTRAAETAGVPSMSAEQPIVDQSELDGQ